MCMNAALVIPRFVLRMFVLFILFAALYQRDFHGVRLHSISSIPFRIYFHISNRVYASVSFVFLEQHIVKPLVVYFCIEKFDMHTIRIERFNELASVCICVQMKRRRGVRAAHAHTPIWNNICLCVVWGYLFLNVLCKSNNHRNTKHYWLPGELAAAAASLCVIELSSFISTRLVMRIKFWCFTLRYFSIPPFHSFQLEHVIKIPHYTTVYALPSICMHCVERIFLAARVVGHNIDVTQTALMPYPNHAAAVGEFEPYPHSSMSLILVDNFHTFTYVLLSKKFRSHHSNCVLRRQ